MRISNEKVAERESFVKALFKKHIGPDGKVSLSIPKANAEVKKQFNSMVRAQRMYEIRTIVENEVKDTMPQANGAPTSGSRKPADKPAERKPITEAHRVAAKVAPVSHAEVMSKPKQVAPGLIERGVVSLGVVIKMNNKESPTNLLSRVLEVARKNGLTNLGIEVMDDVVVLAPQDK